MVASGIKAGTCCSLAFIDLRKLAGKHVKRRLRPDLLSLVYYYISRVDFVTFWLDQPFFPLKNKQINNENPQLEAEGADAELIRSFND